MDPHVPYAPPAPFDRMFEPHPTEGHPARDPRTDYKEPLDRERMIAQYDGDIAFGDREFGRFLRELKARGLYDDALIVFLADHGEEFLDHGLWLHGRSLFDELIRVPLVVKFPGRRGRAAAWPSRCRALDVLPTVLEAMGVPLPPTSAAAAAGRSPARRSRARRSPRSATAASWPTACGPRRDKYIRRFSPDDDELYFDLRGPEGADDLAGASPRARAAPEARPRRPWSPNPFRYVVAVAGPAASRRLETRGWIEGVEATGPRSAGALDA